MTNLTLEELEILKHLHEKRTNSEIAEILHKSVHTIKFQVNLILKKLKNKKQPL